MVVNVSERPGEGLDQLVDQRGAVLVARAAQGPVPAQGRGVPHYWLADPATRTLVVYRWQPEGYLLVLSAVAPERVHAEPFAAIELSVAALFGAEDDA